MPIQSGEVSFTVLNRLHGIGMVEYKLIHSILIILLGKDGVGIDCRLYPLRTLISVPDVAPFWLIIEPGDRG